MTEVKTCPSCGKNMIPWKSENIYLSNPPQWDVYWRCGCGHKEIKCRERGVFMNELWLEQWKNANR